MTASLRLTLTALLAALALALGVAPLAAQNTTQAAPVSNDVIGPSELRDFSLGGPVRRAPPAPSTAPVIAPSSKSPPPASTTVAPPAQAAPRPAGRDSGVFVEQPPAQQPSPARPAPRAPAPDASSSVTFALPSADIGPGVPSPGAEAGSALGSQPGAVPVAPPQSASIPLDSGPPMWPWLLAALVAGFGVLYYAKRQRSRPAVAAPPLPFEAPRKEEQPPEPAQRVAPRTSPEPALAPEQPISSRNPGMIVSTRLRPRIDIQFMPERLIVEQDKTTLQFAAMLFNSGNAPALDVLVEAAMFNAEADQDEKIGAFFAHPLGRGERIRELLPLKSLSLRSEVILPTAGLRLFEVEARKLFVPLVGFNALYRWSDKRAQTSESFIVGVDTQGEKMGPFHIDGTARQFRKVATRPHTLRLRK